MTGKDALTNLLNERKQAILHAVCNEHIARAEPVGSEHLASHYSFGVRSATLRNEMAEMTDLGFLVQPHTSAGRVPSERGYRFYVDWLMPSIPVDPREQRAVRRLRECLHDQVNEILREACRLVAELTRYTSVATAPIIENSRLDSLRLLALDRRRLLVVMVLESGRVEHVVVEFEDVHRERTDITVLQARLNARIAGKNRAEMEAAAEPFDRIPSIQRLYQRIVTAVGEKLQPASASEPVVQGESNALREPEFHDLRRLDGLLELLHSSQAVYDLLSREDPHCPVTVIIGSESGYENARECSLVAARYWIGDTVAGAIGVFGPTRMRYSQAVPVVELVAREVSALLTGTVEGHETAGSRQIR